MNSMNAAYAASQAQGTPDDINITTEKAEKAHKATEKAAQRASEGKNELEADEMASPVKAQKKLDARTKDVKKSETAKRVQESVLVRKEADDLAGQFSKKNKNYFLDAAKFSSLAQKIAEKIGEIKTLGKRDFNLAVGSILKMVRDDLAIGKKPADPSQVDKALEFLIEFADKVLKDPELSANISAAKESNGKQFKTEIKTGEKLVQMQERAQKDVGADKVVAGSFEDIRNTLKTPEELVTIFSYFEANNYSKEQVNKYFKSICEYVGTEIKTPTTTFEDKAVIHTLTNAARTAQAGLGERKVFKDAMSFIINETNRQEAPIR